MRIAIAFFAVLLLGIGVFTRLQPDETLVAFGGASLRAGVVMAIWWLAYPQVQYIPRWLAVASAITLFLVMRRPILMLVAIPLLAVLWFLGPRARRGDA